MPLVLQKAAATIAAATSLTQPVPVSPPVQPMMYEQVCYYIPIAYGYYDLRCELIPIVR